MPDVPEVRAAGGVLWRPSDGGFEVLLVHRPRYDDWSLPKGKLDADESWEDGARREVREETGMVAALGPLVATIRYRDSKDRAKEVRYYEMARPEGRFVANDEVDEIVWLPAAEARRRATRPADGDVVAALAELLATSGGEG